MQSLTNRLRRITRDGRWLPEIDGLRFIAIMSVLLYHVLLSLLERAPHAVEPRYHILVKIVSNGAQGVRLFFVISGFILALPFARHLLTDAKPVSLKKYFLRRVTRLEPPYVLTIILGILVSGSFGAVAIHHSLASLFYIHNLVYGYRSSISPVTWTLEVEIQFYLLAPLFMQLYRLRGKVVRRGILISLILAVSLVQPWLEISPRLTWAIPHFLHFFLMGLLLADIYLLDGIRIPRMPLWDAAGILGFFFLFTLNDSLNSTQILLPWVIAPAFAGAMYGPALNRIFKNAWVTAVGGMCYSIYLIHMPVIRLLSRVAEKCVLTRLDFLGNYLIQCAVLGIPAIALATVFYLVVERPCMNPDWPTDLYRKLSASVSKPALLDSDSGEAL